MMKTCGWIARVLLTILILSGTPAWSAEAGQEVALKDPGGVYRTIGLGAAAAFTSAVSILGAAYAVGRIGSAAIGALTEKPELLPKAILIVALAEGLAVLGFAVAMMLLQRI